MRLVPAIPEAERLIGWPLLQEIPEIPGIVLLADCRRRWVKLLAGELGPGRIPLEPASRVIARCPSLPCEPDKVAGDLEQIRKDGKLARKYPEVVARILQLPGMHPCQDTCPRRRALRVRRKGIGKQHAFPRHSIKTWRVHKGVTICAEMRRVIRDRKKDVWFAHSRKLDQGITE